MYLHNWRNPAVKRNGKVVQQTINSPGIYDGLDIEQLGAASRTESALIINTTGLVRIRGSSVKTNGTGLFDITAAGRQVLYENSILEGAIPPGTDSWGRLIDGYRFALLGLVKCDFVNHGGVKMANAGWAGGTYFIEECRSLNVMSAKADGAGGLAVPAAGDVNCNTAAGGWKQIVQFTGLNAPSLCRVRWLEGVNRRGQSQPGDSISIIDSVGAPGNPILVEDFLVDGGYALWQYSLPVNGSYLDYQASPLGNRLTYSGTGAMIEGASSGYITRRRGILIACGNGGMSMYDAAAGTCLNDDNIIVSSGLAPDGTPLMGARGPGMHRNAPSGSWNNNYVRHSRLVYSGAYNTTTREDHAGALGSMAGTVPGDTGVAVTLADEQAQRAAWLAKKRAAGIYPGSNWMVSPVGY